MNKSNQTFIIKVEYGGLGDHLFYSHLPRIAKQVFNYEKVLISNKSDFRHPDIKRLIWEFNPFIDGFCDEDTPVVVFNNVPSGMNILDKIMIERGIDDGIRFHEPEIFYNPHLKAELSNSRIFDPNYVSYVGAISKNKILNKIEKMGGVDFQLYQRDKSFGVFKNIPNIRCLDLFDYCDLIASCKQFYCLTSGGATLSAALGKPCIAFYGFGQKAHFFHHSKLHQYIDVSSVFSIAVGFIEKKYIFIKKCLSVLLNNKRP